MMKKLIAGLAGIAIVAALALPFLPQKAAASTVVMCAPRTSGAASGPRFITIQDTSQNTYTLDNNGCAPVNQYDVGYLTSQGFVQAAGMYTLFGIVSSANSSTAIGSLPASTRIESVTIQETTGNSVTGGFKLGTTNGGSDIIAGITCGASCLNTATDVSMAKRVFSATASQQVFGGAVNSFNSSNVSVTIRYSYF